MKKLFLALLVITMTAASASAANILLKVEANFVEPFKTGTISPANLGTIFPKPTAETIILDCSALTSAGAATDAAAVTAANGEDDNVIVRRNGIEDTSVTGATAGYVILNTQKEDLQVTASLVAPVNLDFEFSSSSTPIPVNSISQSSLPTTWGATPGTNDFAPLFLGPVLEVPAAVENGVYKGTLDIKIEAI